MRQADRVAMALRLCLLCESDNHMVGISSCVVPVWVALNRFRGGSYGSRRRTDDKTFLQEQMFSTITGLEAGVKRRGSCQCDGCRPERQATVTSDWTPRRQLQRHSWSLKCGGRSQIFPLNTFSICDLHKWLDRCNSMRKAAWASRAKRDRQEQPE
jgi:hypothetical protein